MNAIKSNNIYNKSKIEKKLGFFEKYLTLWVALCIIIGIIIGRVLPDISVILSEFQYAHVSIPIAICLFFMIYPIMVQIDFRKVIDKGKILLVNLAKGSLGEDISSFLGSLIITKIQLAALSRINVPESQRKDFYLYVDEFQEFVASETFDGILSEARKYRLCLMLAHQYIGQLDEELKKAIFGNVGTVITFPVGPDNGEFLNTCKT